jgi:hypothetical protein
VNFVWNLRDFSKHHQAKLAFLLWQADGTFFVARRMKGRNAKESASQDFKAKNHRFRTRNACDMPLQFGIWKRLRTLCQEGNGS